MISLSRPISVLVALVVGLIAAKLVCYTTSENEQAIITQFGKPVGGAVTNAGLHFKVPLIQTIHRIEKRILEWDGRASEMPTRDKLYIVLDTFGRWRINDPLQYFTRLRDERSALSRLDDIIGSEVRNFIAKHDLIEIVRTEKNRKALTDQAAEVMGLSGTALLPIQRGRALIEQEIVAMAAPKLKDFGIELIDVRFMRVNYNPGVSAKVYERMMSERQQIASRFRSEGEGEAAKILGNKERELRQIESESYREVQKLKGEGDAKATEIYARVYGASADAAEFYGFMRTMQSYPKMLGAESTLILSTDSDVFRYLKQANPAETSGASTKGPRLPGTTPVTRP